MGGVVILSLETVTVFVYRYYINELYYPHWLLVWHGVLPCDDAYAVPNSKKPSHALLSATCPDAMLENTKQSVTWPEDSALGVGHWTQRISNLCTAKHWHFRLNQGVPVTKLNNADVFICRKHMLMKKIFNFPPIIFFFFLMFTITCWLEKSVPAQRRGKYWNGYEKWAQELDVDLKRDKMNQPLTAVWPWASHCASA